MSAFMGELIGTAIILLFGCGSVAGVVLNKTKSNNSGWIVITVAWAIGVTLGIFASGPVSGAHLNPAVTIGLAVIGKFEWAKVPLYILAQFLGAMIGATLVWLSYKDHFEATEDKGAKIAVFSTGPAIRNIVSNFITEFIATFILLFVILAIGVTKFTEGLNPMAVGLLILGLGLSFGGPTGYALNPARDLGPRIMHFLLPISNKGDSDWSYAWVPVVSPVCGAITAALTYKLVYG
ncbi:MAG: aquaporin family protein [Candidatus Riflebacteria bacterium]|nr:aquaporin family protein [Candidatus Riflebacteria bacterium]